MGRHEIFMKDCQAVPTWMSSIAPVVISDLIIKLLLELWMLLKVLFGSHGANFFLFTKMETVRNQMRDSTSMRLAHDNSFALPSTLVLQLSPSPNAPTPSKISPLLPLVPPTVGQCIYKLDIYIYIYR